MSVDRLGMKHAGPSLTFRLVLAGWALVLIPGSAADVAFAPPEERVPTNLVIIGLALIVAGVARFWPRVLGPGTAVLGAVMALADPFEPGPLLWRVTTTLADIVLAGLGLALWRSSRGPRRSGAAPPHADAGDPESSMPPSEMP